MTTVEIRGVQYTLPPNCPALGFRGIGSVLHWTWNGKPVNGTLAVAAIETYWLREVEEKLSRNLETFAAQANRHCEQWADLHRTLLMEENHLQTWIH